MCMCKYGKLVRIQAGFMAGQTKGHEPGPVAIYEICSL